MELNNVILHPLQNVLSFSMQLLELDFKSIKFYNTSFREYVGIYDEYIIGVYPFVIAYDKLPIDYSHTSFSHSHNLFSHNDYKDGIISIDPCDIFEEVSGIRIHHGDLLPLHLNDYSYNIKCFNSYIISRNRNNKLDSIGI